MTNNCPRIVIAATNSGAGKTSISLGLTRALTRRGLNVQTFKVGPDFLDPTYLSMASGRTCYNLDSWMMGKDYLPKLFTRTTQNADIAIIEGVMGLYDGASPTSLDGSTAEVANILDTPIVLIANARGASRSFAAMVKGYSTFEERINISAVIANRCGSDRHKKWLAESLAAAQLPEMIGCELIEFSPINDATLPDDLDGLYIGGGYPEEFAKELSVNEKMRNGIAEFAGSNKPIYAECGGLMYLRNKLITSNAKEYPMVGLLDINTKMLDRFKTLGYVQVDLLQDSLWGTKDTTIRGHEFHYSEITEPLENNHSLQKVYSVKRRSGSESSIEGFQKQNILASYMHLHFASQPQTVKNFVKTMEINRDKIS